MDQLFDKHFEQIKIALMNHNDEFIGFKDKSEFDRASDHIYSLLTDSFILLKNKSYSSSIFFSISAIEEIAKAEIGIFRGWYPKPLTTRAKDPLFNHSKKQIIACSPTVLIGSRLKKSLGEKRVNEIFQDLYNGKLKELRENCLYFKRDENSFYSPKEALKKIDAIELLLFSIEVFDDRLIGITHNSGILEEQLNKMYLLVEELNGSNLDEQ